MVILWLNMIGLSIMLIFVMCLIQRQVRLKGPDAVRLAQLLTPRNLENLEIGKGLYMPICNSKGTLVNDQMLLRLSRRLWLSLLIMIR